MFLPHRSKARHPSATRRRHLIAAVAVATLATLLPLVGAAAPAHAQAGTPPYWSLSPFAVPSGTGASVPFTEYEAVNASYTGSVIGPDFTQGDLATEAVDRRAVQLTAQGQYVQFTLTSAANAFDLHYAVPQGASGTLSVYVNGTKLSQQLSLTSAYSYITTGDITGSTTHKMYDDVRMMLGQTVNAGGTVKFEVDSGNSATPYTINVADFFNVGAALSQPANSISVTSEGADPTGVNDSTTAFRNAISAANSAGEPVWIPPGTYLVGSALQVNSATIEGAGYWYSQIKSNEFIDNTSAVSGPVNLSNFAILGNTVGRHDDSTANAINGSLGTGSTVNGLWIQDTNVGFWLQYGNTNITVENCIVLSTDADGLNFNGNASGNTVKNNFFRNVGDDGLAIWSYPTADSNITFANNTIVESTLANGIADYGGSNNTITNNVIADTNALGSGLVISNEAFLQPFTPLSGTITVTGNYLIRTGAYNPNWGHPMSAVGFDAYNTDFTGVTVNYSGGAILDSPYSAFQFVGGDGTGHVVNGVSISNVQVQNTGTTVMQAETTGSTSVSGVTASGIGVAGAYNDSYPGLVAGAYTFNLGSGNSGWSTTPVLTTFPEPVQAGSLKASPASLSFGDVKSGSTSAAQSVTVTNPGSSAASVSSIGVTGPFSQTNNCGGSIAAGGSCTVQVTFAAPASGGAQTGSLSVASSAPGSPLTVALSGTSVTSTTNLALNQPVTASSSTSSSYTPQMAVDGNTSTYWESSDGAAYPQWITVDLGSVQSIGSITLDLPPSSAWSTRTETLSVLGSTNNTTFSQIVASAGYTFNPSTGNTVTISLPSGTSTRYVQLNFTANTGWSAAQLSEFEVFPGGATTGSALTASPSSVSFGNQTVGQTSAAQTVTVSNPGSSSVSISQLAVSGPFSQTNTCGATLGAGASCTVSVSFAPTAAGAASGSLTVASSAPNSPLSVPLSGTGVSSSTNLALNQPATASGTTQNYVPANAVDGNTSTYWESTDNAFPQWFQVDLGSAVSISRVVMDLPPLSSWATRTQTITIQGSTDGTNYTTLAGSAAYTFNSPANTVTVTFSAASVRYLKLTFTANTGWPAGQLSELQVYSS
jgi:hypothetical protein